MTTLEDVARWHDSEATVLDAKAAHSGFGKDCAYAWAAIKHRASAAACRELAERRATPATRWQALHQRDTDAALAEIE